ncbi:hypothetical protein [Oryza sativa Japonica Group]|uniref:START domain-containing protein n=1 Tax=Oryza sativa subsp. japonica TaxID=39947 RepID=Q5VNS7_ORYSJ|nr:hypothetical protein [Oryza sativa Japonica Group]
MASLPLPWRSSQPQQPPSLDACSGPPLDKLGALKRLFALIVQGIDIASLPIAAVEAADERHRGQPGRCASRGAPWRPSSQQRDGRRHHRHHGGVGGSPRYRLWLHRSRLEPLPTPTAAADTEEQRLRLENAVQTNSRRPLYDNDDKPRILELATRVLDELVEMCSSSEPLWVRGVETDRDILNYDEYVCLFHRDHGGYGDRMAGWSVEAYSVGSTRQGRSFSKSHMCITKRAFGFLTATFQKVTAHNCFYKSHDPTKHTLRLCLIVKVGNLLLWHGKRSSLLPHD